MWTTRIIVGQHFARVQSIWNGSGRKLGLLEVAAFVQEKLNQYRMSEMHSGWIMLQTVLT